MIKKCAKMLSSIPLIGPYVDPRPLNHSATVIIKVDRLKKEKEGLSETYHQGMTPNHRSFITGQSILDDWKRKAWQRKRTNLMNGTIIVLT